MNKVKSSVLGKVSVLFMLVAMSMQILIGCNATNTTKGGAIGAGAGGAIGGVIGSRSGNTVERVGEGIKITFNSGLLFNVNSSQLSPTTQQNLRELAATLNKYEDTNILIEGHTDNTGSDDHNQKLSEERAKSVASFLGAQNVKNSRITTTGYGESQPVADNNSDSGRDQNRRVEVAIFANKKMKKWAEKNEAGNS